MQFVWSCVFYFDSMFLKSNKAPVQLCNPENMLRLKQDETTINKREKKHGILLQLWSGNRIKSPYEANCLSFPPTKRDQNCLFLKIMMTLHLHVSVYFPWEDKHQGLSYAPTQPSWSLNFSNKHADVRFLQPHKELLYMYAFIKWMLCLLCVVMCVFLNLYGFSVAGKKVTKTK